MKEHRIIAVGIIVVTLLLQPADADQIFAGASVSFAGSSGSLVTGGIAFYRDLRPYGLWMHMEPFGLVWRPAVAASDMRWRPYLNNGYWVTRGSARYWESFYKWGSIVFHYGRWYKSDNFGWVWVPDTTWGPAWVTWMNEEGLCGWAPMPPSASHCREYAVEHEFAVLRDDFVFVVWRDLFRTDVAWHVVYRRPMRDDCVSCRPPAYDHCCSQPNLPTVRSTPAVASRRASGVQNVVVGNSAARTSKPVVTRSSSYVMSRSAPVKTDSAQSSVSSKGGRAGSIANVVKRFGNK
ncbi:MAG: hypothetical protein JXN60_01930 [Lentisphaerae bacterium]|nr:hypothetical protein [Lentisphaerota bacterium]